MLVGVPLAKRRRPRTIPPDAIPEEPTDQGAATRYFVGTTLAASVHWHSTGHPAWVWHHEEDGRKHGVERYYDERGRRVWEARWQHGLQHGAQREWDARGELVCETRFVRGTGRDLWWGGARRLSELREYVDGVLHGVEQWWASARTVFREAHHWRGRLHGISREWTNGRLDAGSPAFFVHGRRVSRERYVASAISDPTLPPYLTRDDRPARRCPVPQGGLAGTRPPEERGAAARNYAAAPRRPTARKRTA
jgi:hypothetical protein